MIAIAVTKRVLRMMMKMHLWEQQMEVLVLSLLMCGDQATSPRVRDRSIDLCNNCIVNPDIVFFEAKDILKQTFL